MYRLALWGLVTVVVACPSWAGDDWEQELKKDVVTIVEGKMVYEEFELCTIPPAEQDQGEYTMQIKTHSEAPATSFISRDNFVVVTVAAAMALAQGAADCKTLDAPIGSPDLEISIFMTSAGMQLEVNDTTTGQKDRSTILWQDWFGE